MSDWTYSVEDDETQFDIPLAPSYVGARTPRIPGVATRSFDMIAEHCADDYHSNHDGWEARWPLIFWLYEDGKNVARVSVERETLPHFVARVLP